MSKLKPVVAIAVNAFRESVRDRILYALILFSFIATILGIVLGSLSIGQDIRVLEDFGLAAIAFIGGVIAVFAGTNLVYKELERRTIYLIFTKPVSGWQFIAGKYLGLCLCVLVMVAFMAAFLIALVSVVQGGWSTAAALSISNAVALIYLELLFVVALATFFSTFATPVMSVLFTLSLWLAGHLGSSLNELGRLSQSPLVTSLTSAIFWLLPDFASLTKIRAYIVYGQGPGLEAVAFMTCYVAAYIVILLVLSAIVTERKEFA